VDCQPERSGSQPPRIRPSTKLPTADSWTRRGNLKLLKILARPAGLEPATPCLEGGSQPWIRHYRRNSLIAERQDRVKNLKHRALPTTIYATGLRVSEVTNLLVSDIDSSRMIIQVRQGKGRKDRFVMPSPNLLTMLREYWKAHHPKHWLFPGQNPSRPIDPATAYRVCQRGRGGQAVEVYFTPHTAPFVRDAPA